VERTLLVRLHVGGVVPQADGEARVLVAGILSQPTAAQPFEPLALGEDVLPVGALELAPRSRPKLAPCNSDHHGDLLDDTTRRRVVPVSDETPGTTDSPPNVRCAEPRPRAPRARCPRRDRTRRVPRSRRPQATRVGSRRAESHPGWARARHET